ncbi:MAG: DUF2793 domain-containing protein [Pseudomonadota bacterium]
MEQSPRLSLSYVMPAQAQKHVTVNESFRRLDALTQLAVLSRTVAAEPGAPAEGDSYILPASPTGTDWGNFSANNIAAFQDGAWIEIASVTGWRAWIGDENALAAFNGAGWGLVTGGGAAETAPQFGVNTSADATNRFAVKSDAVLISHDDVTPGTGDIRINVNKETISDTASYLFQTGFSGRAEFGLVGNDDFQLKVSADGATWHSAMTIDKENGNIGIGTDSPDPDAPLHILLQSAENIKFQWAGGVNQRVFLKNNVGAADQRTFAFNIRGNNESRMILQAYDDSYTAIRNLVFFNHDGGIEIGSPTGGNRGEGSLNAQGVFDDNTLLSCYVFDQVLDAQIDIEKWDAKVPARTIPLRDETGDGAQKTEARSHGPARRFAARIGTAHDPLTLDGYAQHWREKRHLTAMPNEENFSPEDGLATGEWIQRLVETVEIQAVLIEQLNTRLKTVEAAHPLKRV